MKNKNVTEAKRWFQQAVQDVDDARFNLSGRRFNVACFLAHQATEKALKAFLIFNGAEEVWGHSTSDLCKDAKDFDKELEKMEAELAALDKYYIPTRYPNALPGGIPSKSFDESDANRAISIAEKAINFIKSRSKDQL